MAYLGKISAVLAANTQDFTRGIREAGQELQRFQRQASGLRLNLDSNALDKTLTHLQRFEKTIQEIKRQIAANPDQRGLFPNPEQLQKQFRLFEDIGRPLTALKSQVEGLSKSMQSGLYPELGKIQAQFQSLYRTISSGPQRLAELGKIQKDLSSQLASTASASEASRLKAEIADVAREADGLRRALDFSNQARTVESMTVALQRFGRVAAAAADFGKLAKSLDASGVGASFYQPRAKDALVKTASLRGRAEQLPPQYRGEQFSNLTQLAETNSQEIEAQVAKLLKIESMIARRGEKSNLVAARGMAQENLDRLSTKQEYLNTKLQREISSANISEIVSPPQQQSVVQLTSQFKSLSTSLRDAAGARFDPLIKSVGGIVEQLNRGATSADKAKAAVERLAAAAKGFQTVGRMEDQAAAGLRTKKSVDLETIRRQGQMERSSAPYEGATASLTQKQQKSRDQYVASSRAREEAGIARESFNRTLLPRFVELGKNSEDSADSVAFKQAQDTLRVANQMDSALRKAFSAQDPKVAAKYLAEYKTLLAGVLSTLGEVEKKTRSLAAASADFSNLSKQLRASNSGASFSQPRAKESLQESLALRGRAEQVPARFRGSVFADLASDAEDNARRIELQAAKILQIQDRIAAAGSSPPARLISERDQAQQGIDRLTSRQEAINSAYRQEIRSAEIQQIVSPGSDRAVDSLTQRFAALSATLRGISGTQFEPLIGSVGKVVEQLNRGAISADKAKVAIEKLAAAGRGTQLVGRMEDQAISTLRTKQSLDRETIRRQGQIERSSAPYQGEMGPLTERQQKQRDAYLASSQVRQDAGLAREDFNRTLLPRFAELQKSAEGTGDTRAIKQAQDMIRLANQMDSALRKAFSSQDPAVAAQHLAKHQAQLTGLLPALDRAEKKTKTLSDAQKQYGMFVSASGGRGEKLDPVLEGAASDIMTARQFRGQFAEGNLKGRVAVSQEIMRVEGEILRLTKIRQLIEDKPGLSNDKRAKAYERNRKEIEAETQALLKLTAAESGGVFGERRVLAAAQRARKNTGSFGVAGSAAAQLAFQQGLFAIDDFSSATGGLEYKLRAVGNNITQLGLLLGQSGVIPGLSATTGLFIGLSAVLGGQLALFLGKTIFNFEQADESLKAMNGAMEKSKNLAEQNAKAFKDFADSVKDVGAVGSYAGAAGIQKQIAAMEKSQKEQIESNLSARLPEVADATAKRQLLEDRLSKARDPGARATLLIDIENAKAAEKIAKSTARTLPAYGEVGDAVRRGFSAEGRGIEAAGTRNPRSNAEAKSMLDARMGSLKKLQDDTSSFTKMQSDNLYEFMIEFINPMQLRLVQEYRERNKAIADIERLRAKVDAADTQENFNRVNDMSGKGLAKAQAASSASGRMSSAGVDADVRGEIDRRMTFLAEELSSAIQGAGAAAEVGDKGSLAAAEKNAAAAISQLGKSMERIDRILAGVALGATIPTAARLDASGSRVAGLGPSDADTAISRAKVALDQATREREQAAAIGDEAGVNAADARLAFLRNFAKSLDKAAYAVESFSRAAANAATELSRTLAQEAKSNADQLRRRANKLAGDPLEGRQSKDDLAEARGRQAKQEQDDRDMRRAVAAERLAFEQDVKNGRDPEGAALLNRIQAGKDAENNKELTPAQQEARRADAEQAQAELDARIARRPGVVAQAEKVDARDAAVQARLEAERVRREQLSLGMQAADSSADAAKRMFSETGNVDGAIGARRIEDAIRDVRRKIGEAPADSKVSKELEDELKRLQDEADMTRAKAVSALIEKRQKAGTGFDAQMRAAQQEMQGVGISGLQAPMAKLEVRRADLERRREEAVAENNPAKAAAIQAEIDATDMLAGKINAAAIAVAAFQNAANKAAMELQNSVAREADSMASESRRSANEAEAVFGANAPRTKEERERQGRLEAEAKAAQRERDDAQAEIDNARVKHEEEIRRGMNPAAAARAEQIRANEEIAQDATRPTAERQRAKNEADKLRREQEAEFEARPEVQGARKRADEADVRLQGARSADRGRDLTRTSEDRFNAETERGFADIQTYFERRAEANNGLRPDGDVKAQADAEERFRKDREKEARTATAAGRGRELGMDERDRFRRDMEEGPVADLTAAAKEMQERGENPADFLRQGIKNQNVTPMLQQFEEERQNALLQGPSRAALNVADVSTTQGQSELTRLLRGDDSAKDVNLAELRKQTQKFDDLINAVRAANPGVLL